MKNYKALCALVLLLFSLNGAAENCLEVRAAFDIGSGTTKLKVAQVNKCHQKIIKYLYEEEIPVGYKEALKNSASLEFDSKIKSKALTVLAALKKKAKKYKPVSYVGGATAAFREAKNGQAFAKEIHDKLKISVEVISQDREAQLGFAAGAAKVNSKAEDLIVWDIGGASMQITSYKKPSQFVTYKGQLASVSFKNLVIKKIKGLNPLKVESPNPLNIQQLNKSVALARAESQRIPESIKHKIRNGAEILGIGGVHYYSVRKQVSKAKKSYTYAEVKKALKDRAGMTNKQIGGPYASTEISNLALVAGFMEGLNVKAIQTAKINVADGLLVSP